MERSMIPDRRTLLAAGSSTFVLSCVMGAPGLASLTQRTIDALTQGAPVTEGGVDLILPQTVDDGYAVPVTVDAPGAAALSIIAEANPTPHVVTFTFGVLSATRRAKTRIRLAGPQTVVALARMEDNTFRMAASRIDVLAGGCGV